MDLDTLRKTFAVDEIVITGGGRCGYAIDSTGRKTVYCAKPVNRIFDTTGAGDVFFAAYLTRRYHMSGDMDVSLDHATDIAAAFIQGEYIPHDILSLDRSSGYTG
jgi:sugar/nucleoside kinase (ribokinase family)